MHYIYAACLLFAVSLLLTGCEVVEKTIILSGPSKKAIAVINSASGSALTGMATFTQIGETVMFQN